MYAVIGATGKTGGAVLRSLRAAGQPVRAVVRDRDRAEALGESGAAIGVATIADAGALAQAFAEASAAYVMLPPSLGAADFLAEKDAEIEAIATAVRQVRLPHVVLLSSIGAQHAAGTGPIVALHRAEAALADTGCALTVVRAGYFLENFAMLLPSVRRDGILPSFMPARFAYPIVATPDVGEAAAQALVEGPRGTRIIELAGPREASAADVAAILGALLGREVGVAETPLEAIEPAFTSIGASPDVARLYREMIEGLAGGHVRWEGGAAEARRGRVDLESGLSALLA